jgi:hypothetical protein
MTLIGTMDGAAGLPSPLWGGSLAKAERSEAKASGVGVAVVEMVSVNIDDPHP